LRLSSSNTPQSPPGCDAGKYKTITSPQARRSPLLMLPTAVTISVGFGWLVF
jgi:hypothetical protein